MQPLVSLEGGGGAEWQGRMGRQAPEGHRWCRMTALNELHQGEGSLIALLMTVTVP